MVGIFGMGCAEFDYQMICALFIFSPFFHSDTFLESPFLLPKEWWAYTTILFLSYPSVPTLGPLSYIASVIPLKCPCLGEDKSYTSFLHIKEDNDCACRDRHVIINDFWAKTQACMVQIWEKKS